MSFCGRKYGTVTDVFPVLQPSILSLIPPMLRRYIIFIYHQRQTAIAVVSVVK